MLCSVFIKNIASMRTVDVSKISKVYSLEDPTAMCSAVTCSLGRLSHQFSPVIHEGDKAQQFKYFWDLQMTYSSKRLIEYPAQSRHGVSRRPVKLPFSRAHRICGQSVWRGHLIPRVSPCQLSTIAFITTTASLVEYPIKNQCIRYYLGGSFVCCRGIQIDDPKPPAEGISSLLSKVDQSRDY